MLELDGPNALERSIVLALTDLDEAARAGEGARREPLIAFLGQAVRRVPPPAADALALRLAEGLIRAHRHDDAQKQLESLLARNPHNGDALRVLSEMMAERGDWELATDIRRRLLVDVLDRGGSKGELVQVALSTAQAAGKCNRLEHVRKAVAGALDVLATRPLFVPELVSLCEAIGAWSRLADVLEAEASRREDPADKVHFLLRAATTLLEHGEDPSGALRVARHAQSLQPESVDASIVFARACVALGRTDDAIAALRGAAQLVRGQRSAIAGIHLEIAKAYLAVDDLLEASEALKEAFAADWRTGEVALLLGLLSIDISDDRTAERALTAVTTLPVREGNSKDMSNKATGFYHLASMAYAKGDWVKAKLLAAKAVDMCDHADARGLLRRLAQEKASNVAG
jgi:tetratricopeptide (TPR) repeat protein